MNVGTGSKVDWRFLPKRQMPSPAYLIAIAVT